MWDSSINFTGKRVAVIGSGASAVQAVPELSKVAAKLHNYQRSAIWCKIRGQYAYSSFVKFLFRWFPFVMKLYRLKIYLKVYILICFFLLTKKTKQRKKREAGAYIYTFLYYNTNTYFSFIKYSIERIKLYHFWLLQK